MIFIDEVLCVGYIIYNTQMIFIDEVLCVGYIIDNTQRQHISEVQFASGLYI